MRTIAKALILGYLALSLCAQDDSFARESLRGIKVIQVTVEDVPSDVAAQTGLTKERIRTAVEFRLRRVGLTVNESSPGSDASLVVAVDGVPIQTPDGRATGVISGLVSIGLDQEVTLVRNPQKTVFAVTWRSVTIVGASTGRFVEGVGRAIPELMEQFLNAYLSVNPKPSSGN